mmetsp:Transcript_25925/g.50819  ORF Transcript_25925/g.50819 Transcript_25925/m.50819 type:complete len:316 (+) Transcript_25925:2101-3048(+)
MERPRASLRHAQGAPRGRAGRPADGAGAHQRLEERSDRRGGGRRFDSCRAGGVGGPSGLEDGPEPVQTPCLGLRSGCVRRWRDPDGRVASHQPLLFERHLWAGPPHLPARGQIDGTVCDAYTTGDRPRVSSVRECLLGPLCVRAAPPATDTRVRPPDGRRRHRRHREPGGGPLFPPRTGPTATGGKGKATAGGAARPGSPGAEILPELEEGKVPDRRSVGIPRRLRGVGPRGDGRPQRVGAAASGVGGTAGIGSPAGAHARCEPVNASKQSDGRRRSRGLSRNPATRPDRLSRRCPPSSRGLVRRPPTRSVGSCA